MIYVLICDETKTITANNRSTVNDGIITNTGPMINMYIWKDIRIFTNTRFLANYCLWTNIWIVLDYNTSFNDRERSNGYIFTNLSFWVNICSFINTAWELQFRLKLPKYFSNS